MKKLSTLALAITLLMVGSIAWAASNLNLSKSNVNRVADPVAAACEGKKPGDVVKVDGKDVQCQQKRIAVGDPGPDDPPYKPVIKK